MAVIYSTSFTGSENPLSESSVWTTHFGTVFAGANVQKVSGVAEAATSSTHTMARFKGTTLSRQQYAKATNCNANAGAVNIMAVGTRIKSDTDASGYLLYYRPHAGTVEFWRNDDAGSGLSSIKSWSVTTGSNDSIQLRSIGIRHFCYFNGTLLGTIWDTNYQDGQTSIAFYTQSATLSDNTMGDFETGNIDTSTVAGDVPPNYTDFYGSSEDPISEGGFWSNAPGVVGWPNGMKRDGSGNCKGHSSVSTDHNGAYYTGMLTGDQSASSIVKMNGSWAGVATRIQGASDGSCYLAFVWDAPEGRVVRLLRAKEGDSPFFALNHGPVAEAAGSSIPDDHIIELESKGNVHKVYVTYSTSQVEGSRTLMLTWTHPAAGAASGYLVNNGAGYAAGTTALQIDTGSGSFVAGDLIAFAGTTGTYTVVSHSGSTLTIKTADQDLGASGGLDAAVADNAAITYVARLSGGYPLAGAGGGGTGPLHYEWWSENLSGEWLLGSGGVHMGGAADTVWTKNYIGSGGVHMGGSAGLAKTKLYLPSGLATITLGGVATTIFNGSGLPLAVFPLVPNFPMDHVLEPAGLVSDFGDGFEYRQTLALAYSRADGMGGLASYRGRNSFTLRFNTRSYSDDATTLWAFFKARKGNLEPFYFYNVPDEAASIDLTGVSPYGRYLVRFKDALMSRDKFTLMLYNHGITFVEVRG